jgi:hypothetical protein
MFKPIFLTLINTLAVLSIGGAVSSALSFGDSGTLLLIFFLSLVSLKLLKLRPLWELLGIITPLAVFISLTSDLSTIAPLCLLLAIVTALINLPTLWTGVPHYPSSRLMYDAVATQLPADRSFSFIDLGSGYGSMLFYLAQKFPQAQFTGYEISVWPFLFSRLRAARHPNVSIHFSSFWELNFGDFDFVYAFLAPAPMPKLWTKASSEMKSGSTFMTSSFPVPTPCDQKIEVGDYRGCVLYIHLV